MLILRQKEILFQRNNILFRVIFTPYEDHSLNKWSYSYKNVCDATAANPTELANEIERMVVTLPGEMYDQFIDACNELAGKD